MAQDSLRQAALHGSELAVRGAEYQRQAIAGFGTAALGAAEAVQGMVLRGKEAQLHRAQAEQRLLEGQVRMASYGQELQIRQLRAQTMMMEAQTRQTLIELQRQSAEMGVHREAASVPPFQIGEGRWLVPSMESGEFRSVAVDDNHPLVQRHLQEREDEELMRMLQMRAAMGRAGGPRGGGGGRQDVDTLSAQTNALRAVGERMDSLQPDAFSTGTDEEKADLNRRFMEVSDLYHRLSKQVGESALGLSSGSPVAVDDVPPPPELSGMASLSSHGDYDRRIRYVAEQAVERGEARSVEEAYERILFAIQKQHEPTLRYLGLRE